jgi:flagellar hook assembly protein FlgD
VEFPPTDPATDVVPTVTPNGDGSGETVVVPYSASEAATTRIDVADPAGAIVRTIVEPGLGGSRVARWDGRTAAGAPVPDGRYTLTLTPTDLAGNIGAPASTPVDVYAALARVARTPGIFFPQDGDRLATKSTVTFRLLAPAAVSITVTNTSGTVVRTAWTDRALPAGAASWAWNGRLDSGAWAPRGTYRFLVRATNGTQASAGSTVTIADAFRITTSTTTPRRGSTFTLTAVTAESLSTTPTVTIRQPGRAAWTVRMTRVSASTWKVSIRPRTGGSAGTMSLTIQARDVAGGANGKIIRLPLR